MTQFLAASMLNAEQQDGKPLLLNVEATDDVARWAAQYRNALRTFVAEHGALLVRGLGLRDTRQAEAVFRSFGTLLPEREGFAPRHCYAPGVYSSSKWPANRPMCLHHELSYALEVPNLMLLACVVSPTKGGATPLADAAAVLEGLPAALVERFERQGWVLIRNYHDDIGTSVGDAFGTDDPGAVERYCRANGIEFEWRAGGVLHTRQRRSAVVRHGLTGQRCWFNQIAFLNAWTMAPELREYLVELYGEDGLPFNTRFGNGDPIGADVVEAINDAYESNAVREAWQPGDLLLVDNVRTAHGREAFQGPREVVVAMADAVRVTDL